MTSPAPIARRSLGDIVVLPPDKHHTIRATVNLPYPAGSMAGFVILGEMNCLLSVPSEMSAPIEIYDRTDHLPASAQTSRIVVEGAMNYWAPHLPALQRAMGEVLYRVILVRGQIQPIVIVYRGPEVIVFQRSAVIDPSTVSIIEMRRESTDHILVTRHSAVVTTPVRVPSPAKAPSHAR